jgi:hypothetical protein
MAKSTQSPIDQAVALLQRWQEVENAGVAQTTQIISKTQNPLVKLLMEIIRHDSIMHHRVQQFMIESMTTRTITLTPEELAEVWTLIEEHIRLEKETIGLGDELKKVTKLFVQSELLAYLYADESKHDMLLERLEQFKRKLYPYA